MYTPWRLWYIIREGTVPYNDCVVQYDGIEHGNYVQYWDGINNNNNVITSSNLTKFQYLS
jgi:hypothetical protein